MSTLKVMHDHQIFTHQKYGGVSRYHAQIIRYLKKHNCKVKVPAVFYLNEYLADMSKISGLYHWKYFAKVFMNRYTYRISEWINKWYCILCAKYGNYDVIHITWTDPYLNKYAKGRMVVTIHDMIHELLWTDSEFARSEIENKKKAIYESEAIIAISNNTKNDILKIYPDIPEEKIHVIYHGTNHLPEAKKPDGLDIPGKYVLYVGVRDAYKRGMILVEALGQLLKEDDSLYILYVGGGAFNEDEEKIINDAGLNGRIMQYSASDSELTYLYRNAVCMIYPSLYEGFGVPILEAFDNCCPVICTNASAMPEVGGEAALYFEKEDINMIPCHVKRLMDDIDYREKCINMGVKQADSFSLDLCTKKTIDVYETIAKEKNRQ